MYGYIYMTTNLINNKKYIGQKTSNKFLGENYLGSGKILLKAVNKYGWNNFKVELLEKCSSQEELDKAEIKWIIYYDAVNSNEFYNLRQGGQTGMRRGSKMSLETRKKMSKSLKGNKKLIESHKGYIMPDYQKRKISEAVKASRKGIKFSEDHKANLSKSHIGILKGSIYVNNGIINKRIKPEEYDYYKSLGYSRGILKQERMIK